MADLDPGVDGDAAGAAAVPHPADRDADRSKAQVREKNKRAHRMRQAASYGLELASLPGRRWHNSASGRLAIHTTLDVSDDIFQAVMLVWDLARRQPPPQRSEVYSIPGEAGMVVVAHGAASSVVARSAGPFLVLADAYEGKVLWRVDGDESWQQELAWIVSELIEVSQGRPPFDESQIPPMPRLPWHGDPDWWRRKQA